MKGWLLLLVGSGDAIPKLESLVMQQGLNEKVRFIPRVPYSELLQYTKIADVGLSLDKDTNINYRYSLPNKIFDYIHCNLPVVTSEVVEVKRIVDNYKIGQTVDPENLSAIREALHEVSSKSYESNLKKAQRELNWEKEQEALKAFYAQFL
jgi:glycosyltransferase involved in cell wall biosynthesis